LNETPLTNLADSREYTPETTIQAGRLKMPGQGALEPVGAFAYQLEL
jgi:hypothetical protein